jgi:hypothetical protein
MSDQIRLAAGFISANALLTDSNTLVTNFPRQTDQPGAIDWFAVQPEFAIQTQVRRGLEVGTGKRVGKLSGTIEFFELTVLMRQYIRDTIMNGKPNAPVTMYIANAEDGFGVYQGELTTSYTTNSDITYQRYDDNQNHNVQYAFRRGTLIQQGAWGLVDGTTAWAWNDSAVIGEVE